MAFLIDTNIAIGLRDVDPVTTERITALDALPVMSIVSRVELEDGVPRGPETAAHRQFLLDELLLRLQILPFGHAEAAQYRTIISARGCHRGRTIDRMIAATAIAGGYTLITANGADFRDIPELRLEIW